MPASVSSGSISRRTGRCRRLKRVFAIEIEQCARCGGRLRVIASIEEPVSGSLRTGAGRDDGADGLA
jgi:hypothetical protein